LKCTSSGLTLNHLIIIGKYFLYINAVQDEKRPQFTDFVTLACCVSNYRIVSSFVFL